MAAKRGFADGYVIAGLGIGCLVGLLAQRWKNRSGIRWTIYAFLPLVFLSVTAQSLMRERNPVGYAHAASWAIVVASLPIAIIGAVVTVIVLALLPRRA